MADAAVSNTAEGNLVRVRIPASAPRSSTAASVTRPPTALRHRASRSATRPTVAASAADRRTRSGSTSRAARTPTTRRSSSSPSCTPRPDHEAFAGVVNGGILGTLLDCHANWTAAWHLMRASAASTGRRRRSPSSTRSGCAGRPRRTRRSTLRAWVVEIARRPGNGRSRDLVRRRRHGQRSGHVRRRQAGSPGLRSLVGAFMCFRRFLGPDPSRRRRPPPRPPTPRQRPCPRPGPRPRPRRSARSSPGSRRCRRTRPAILASFAYVMSRAANADLDISDEETAVMEQFVLEHGGLDEAAGDPRRRDGEDPGPGRGRDRGLRRHPRVPLDLDAGAAPGAPPLLLRDRGGRRDDQRRGGRDLQRDRPRARPRGRTTSTRSATSSTSSCRRSRRSAAPRGGRPPGPAGRVTTGVRRARARVVVPSAGRAGPRT